VEEIATSKTTLYYGVCYRESPYHEGTRRCGVHIHVDPLLLPWMGSNEVQVPQDGTAGAKVRNSPTQR